MKGKQQQDFRVEKYIRYGIRKYSFGAASVAIAAGLMFLGNGAVSASETSVNGNTADSSVVASNPENDGTSTKAETPVTEKEVKAEEPKKEDTSVQKEAEEKTPTEAPKANTEKTALVVQKYHALPKDITFPVEKLKRVIRRYSIFDSKTSKIVCKNILEHGRILNACI